MFYLVIFEQASKMMLYLNLRYGIAYCPVHGWEEMR